MEVTMKRAYLRAEGIDFREWAGQFVHRDTEVRFDYIFNPEYIGYEVGPDHPKELVRRDLGPMGEAFVRTNCDVGCFPHRVCVNDPHGWAYRYARVLKTVAHVVIDEDEYGHPVIERWKIKRHTSFEVAQD
jgi:hypothetical protein